MTPRRSGGYRWAVAALGVISLGFVPASRVAASATVEALWVDLTADGLTVYAEDVPLRSILAEIGRVTGMQIRLDEHGQETLSIAFEDLAVEEGLRRVLRGKSFFMVSSRPGSVGRTRIVGSAGASRPLEFGWNSTATDAVVEALRHESNPRLLERALDSAGRDPATLDVVLKLATSNPEPRVRVKALAHMADHAPGDPRVLDMLEVVAVDDTSPEVRTTARRLLHRLMSP